MRRSAQREETKANRFKFMTEHCSDLGRLKKTDCFECIRIIKQEQNYFRLENELKGIFLYALSKESGHLFDILSSDIVEKLIGIAEWTFEYSPNSNA